MRPEPGQVLHFSEDPTIKRFAPHVAKTAQQPEPCVWAVNRDRAPDYWFPRQCPRAMAWMATWSSEGDAREILGPVSTPRSASNTGGIGGLGQPKRVHAVEYGWLESMRKTQLYAYRFAESDFKPFGDPRSAHAMVCEHEVVPLGAPERVPDVFALHDDAGIELRVLSNLWPFWDRVIASTLDFSGIRLSNARPRPA